MSWVKVASRSSTRRTVFRKVLSWCTWTPLMYLTMLRKLVFRVVICTGNLVPSGVWTGSLYLVPSDKKYTWRTISELKNLHWSCSYREHLSPSYYHLFQRWSKILSPRCYRSSRSGNSWDSMAVTRDTDSSQLATEESSSHNMISASVVRTQNSCRLSFLNPLFLIFSNSSFCFEHGSAYDFSLYRCFPR